MHDVITALLWLQRCRQTSSFGKFHQCRANEVASLSELFRWIISHSKLHVGGCHLEKSSRATSKGACFKITAQSNVKPTETRILFKTAQSKGWVHIVPRVHFRSLFGFPWLCLIFGQKPSIYSIKIACIFFSLVCFSFWRKTVHKTLTFSWRFAPHHWFHCSD